MDEARRKTAPAKNFILVICAIGTFAAFFSNGSTNVALPTLRTAFGITVSQSAIVTVSFALISGVLTLPLGRIGDMIGYKKMYVFGQGCVCLGSILTSLFSMSLVTLVVFRGVIALGCAMVQAVTQALLQRSFPPERRGSIMGINSACISASGLLSPVIAGLLIDWISWRGIFYILIPFSALAFILSAIFMEDFKGKKVSMDYLGAVLLVVFLTSLMLLLNGRVLGMQGNVMLMLGLLAFAALLLFVLQEKRREEPLLDLSIFQYRTFLIGNLGFLAGYGISGILQISLTYYISYTRGYSSTVTSLFVMIHSLMMTLMASTVGGLSDKIGTKKLCIAGFACQFAGMLGLMFLRVDTGDLYLITFLVLFGFGAGLFYAPATSMVMGSIPVESGGVAAGVVSATRNIASALGNTVFSLITVVGTTSYGRYMGEAESYVKSMNTAITVSAIAAFISLCLFIYLLVNEEKHKGTISRKGA